MASDSQHARWGEFVARYRPMMAAFMRSSFPTLDADEAIQQTLIALIRIFPVYRYVPDEKGSFHNYLMGVLRHKALKLRAAENRAAERRRALSRAASFGVTPPCASSGAPSFCASSDAALSCAALAKEPAPLAAASAAALSRAAEEEAWRAAVFEIALQQYLADDAVQPRTKQIFTRLALNGEKPEAVTAFLGRGGSGEVYRVEHVETGQAAALKVFAPKADATPESAETAHRRFVHEAEFLMHNAYSFFPKFYAAGETNGCSYVVMELLDARPLPNRDRAVAAFLREICIAVRTLHRRGLVHRAIKPANIL